MIRQLLAQLNTRTKLRIAHALYWTLACFRRSRGLADKVQVTRRGVHWQLDLQEGIDLAIYLFGYFEYETVCTYRRLLKPQDTVLDIGANIGAHTLHLARCVAPTGKVIAFEPTAFAYRKLRQNILLNPQLAHLIQAEQIMLVDSEATQVKPQLYSSWQIHDPDPGTHPKHGGRLMDTTGARSTTLDQYIAEHNLGNVTFIKMDVDGHECQVLHGANELLRRDKPFLLLEVMPYGLAEAGTSIDEFLDILTSYGYSLFELNGRSALPTDRRILQKIPPAGGVNVLCCPK